MSGDAITSRLTRSVETFRISKVGGGEGQLGGVILGLEGDRAGAAGKTEVVLCRLGGGYGCPSQRSAH